MLVMVEPRGVWCRRCTVGYLIILVALYLQQVLGNGVITSGVTVKFKVAAYNSRTELGWELATVRQVRNSLKEVKDVLRWERAWIVVKLKDGAIKGSGANYVFDMSRSARQGRRSRLLIYSCPDAQRKYNEFNAKRFRNVASWELCSKRCSDTTSCKFWTWVSDSRRYCYVMVNPSGKSYDPSGISGARSCRGIVPAKKEQPKASIPTIIGGVIAFIILVIMIGRRYFLRDVLPRIRKCLNPETTGATRDEVQRRSIAIVDDDERLSMATLNGNNTQQRRIPLIDDDDGVSLSDSEGSRLSMSSYRRPTYESQSPPELQPTLSTPSDDMYYPPPSYEEAVRT